MIVFLNKDLLSFNKLLGLGEFKIESFKYSDSELKIDLSFEIVKKNESYSFLFKLVESGEYSKS